MYRGRQTTSQILSDVTDVYLCKEQLGEYISLAEGFKQILGAVDVSVVKPYHNERLIFEELYGFRKYV
jgi:hypothetical protein